MPSVNGPVTWPKILLLLGSSIALSIGTSVYIVIQISYSIDLRNAEIREELQRDNDSTRLMFQQQIESLDSRLNSWVEAGWIPAHEVSTPATVPHKSPQ